MGESAGDALAVGSGASGRIMVSHLAGGDLRVPLIDDVGHHPTGSFSCWELGAVSALWNPPQFARCEGRHGPIVLVNGRAVGGATDVNTKVAFASRPQDDRNSHKPSGPENAERSD